MMQVLFAGVLGISAIFSFWWFWKTNPGLKLWWFRTPTSHALAFGSIAFVLSLFQILYPLLSFLFQFTGVLLIIIGVGHCVGFLFAHKINLLIYVIHIFAGATGVYLFVKGFSSMEEAVLPLAAALGYLGLIGIGFIKRKPTT